MATQSVTGRKVVVFANVRSGSMKHALAPGLRALEASSLDVLGVHINLDPEAMRQAIDHATASGASTVVVMGGDGTIGSVVDAIMDLDVILGVIPCGTSNNFARSVGLPLNPEDAVAVIEGGISRRIDVGQVNGHYFIHAAIMGMNVDFAKRAQTLRRYIGRLSYPVASLFVYSSRRRKKYTISVDGNEKVIDAYELALLNSGVFGGPLPIDISKSEVGDGKLYAVAILNLRVRDIARDLARTFQKRSLGPGAVEFSTVDVRVETGKPTAVTIDGEIRTETPAHFQIRPGALAIHASSESQ